MEIILLAHAAVRPVNNPEGDDYDRFQANLIDTKSTSILAKTREWCDLVLFASYDIMVRKSDPKATKGKGVLKTGTNERLCYSRTAASHDAKVRAGWSLPDKFPLDQGEFRKHLNPQPKDAS